MFENRPTQIAGLVYLLFVVLFIVLISLNTDHWKPLLLILLFSFPFVLINLYDIDCVFNGQCDIWGWFKGVFFIVYLIFVVVVTILLLLDFQNTIDSTKPSSESEESEDSNKSSSKRNTSRIYYTSGSNIYCDSRGNCMHIGSNERSSINLNAEKEKENDKYVAAVVADSNKRGYGTNYWR